MSKRFNPVSAAVAAVTAGLIVAVAGCASDRQATVDNVPPSSDANSQMPNQQSAAPADTSTTTTASSDSWSAPVQTAQAAPAVNASTQDVPSAGDTTATPNMPDQTAQPIAPAAQSSTDYSRPSDSSYNSRSASSTSSTSNVDTTTSSAGAEQPLPPRADRN